MNVRDIEDAAAEVLAYNRRGGVTKEMIEDICHDYNVDMGDVLEEMEWGRDHYSTRKEQM